MVKISLLTDTFQLTIEKEVKKIKNLEILPKNWTDSNIHGNSIQKSSII